MITKKTTILEGVPEFRNGLWNNENDGYYIEDINVKRLVHNLLADYQGKSIRITIEISMEED
jgi:hypothetical protein